MTQDYGIEITPERSFFTIIPNCVDDMDISVYAYRLYGHFKRVAADAGKCYHSTQELADICHMSTGKVSEAKQELVAAGLIHVKKTYLEGRDNPSRGRDQIFIRDIWQQNVNAYSLDEQGGCSPHEDPVHQVKPKEEPKKEEQQQQAKSVSPQEPTWDDAKTAYENNIGLISGRVCLDRLMAMIDEAEGVRGHSGAYWVIEAITKAVKSSKSGIVNLNYLDKAFKSVISGESRPRYDKGATCTGNELNRILAMADREPT